VRVEFKTEGGFAYLPGLSQPVIIDTDGLSPKEAGKLERLVEAAGFFGLRRPPSSLAVVLTFGLTPSPFHPRGAATL